MVSKRILSNRKKTKTVGTTNRPERGSERNQENTETQGEESKS